MDISDIIGQQQKWTVDEIVPTGYWLKNVDAQRLFLPKANATAILSENESIEAVASHDAQNNPVLDMRLPDVPMNNVTTLIAKDATHQGAFFDWGMTRDLYVPAKLQVEPINPGMKYLIHLFVDPQSDRITGATKLHKFYPETSEWFEIGQAVELQVYALTQLGYKVLIDDSVLGLLFHSDVPVKLKRGQKISGFIKQRREDGKLDVTLSAPNKKARQTLAQIILDDLQAHDGLSSLTDKSSPEDIFQRFGVSKGAYKKAIGQLFKQKRITISADCIKLNPLKSD